MRNEIVSRYGASLLDSKRAFNEVAIERHIDVALAALSEIRPQLKIAEIKVAAGRDRYPCPADLIRIHKCNWGISAKSSQRPWDDSYVGALPEWRVFRDPEGKLVLFADPAPTVLQERLIGSCCQLIYTAAHVLTEDECSLNDEEIGLLILRAQVEAMREISMKNTTQSYQLREGISSTPMNGTPAYLYITLMDEFKVRAYR